MARIVFKALMASVILLASQAESARAQAVPTAILPFQGRTAIVGDAAKKSKAGKSQSLEVQATGKLSTQTEESNVGSESGLSIRQDSTSLSINTSDSRTSDLTIGKEKDIAVAVVDLLSIKLLASDHIMLVERQEIDRILDELKLSRAGVVNPAEATQVGRLTGAKLLISGSVVRIDNDLYLIAKVMGTETSRLTGASVKGPANSDLSELVDKLAVELENVLGNKMESLLPKVESEADWIAGVKKTLEDKKLPTVVVNMESRNGKLDLTAVTELNRLLQELGFETVAWDHPNARRADLEVVGEAKSEFAYRRGDWVATRCRIDLQIRSQADGKVLASDSETCMVFDIVEQAAGRSGIQDAIRRLAARVASKLAP